MPDFSTHWTSDEVALLSAGIDAGLSWAEIIATLPGRTAIAVRRKAAALGLAVQSESTPYPYIPDDGAVVTVGDDPLLAALRAEHRAGSCELRLSVGRPVVSLARPSVALSYVGSPAAMASEL